MQKEYLLKVPEWYKEETQELILTDDIDSLLGCSIVSKCRHAMISAFYDFSTMYYTDMYKWTVDNDLQNELIGVDCGLTYGKTYDNHVQKITSADRVNDESINFNVIDDINCDNYFYKYCGSTALMLWSLYGLELPKTEEGKMILLAIDSSFLGFYSNYESNRIANKHYIVDVMEFDELYAVLERHTKQDFYNIIDKYKLAEKIVCRNGKLDTNIEVHKIAKELGIKIELPNDLFVVEQQYKTNRTTINSDCTLVHNSIFSYAITGRTTIQYSTKKGI